MKHCHKLIKKIHYCFLAGGRRLVWPLIRLLKTFALASLVFFSGTASIRAELPVAHSSLPWRNATIAHQTANFMQIDARTESGNNSILEWQSYNISPDSRVQYLQPSASHIALNRIYQNSPSQILGQLDANGRIYLINQNGILFANGAQVNVNSLVASSLALNLDDDAFITGDRNIANSINDGNAAFTHDSSKGSMGDILIDTGAQITTQDGGSVMVFAPNVTNAGNISTRSGQVLLAASEDKIYLTPSLDQSLRGFLIEVGGNGGNVSNLGKVLAERGNITLAGLAINNAGTLEATTSVFENGSIRLLARASATVISTESVNNANQNNNEVLRVGIELADDGAESNALPVNIAVAQRTGDVVLESQSRIVVRPEPKIVDAGDEEVTEVPDAQSPLVSHVEITGNRIQLKNDAGISAQGGEVILHATASPNNTAIEYLADDARLRNKSDSIILMEQGSFIDVSGTTDTVVAMERNQLEVQLTGAFLQDSPLNRDGSLRGERVNVDVREGTPLGDIAPQLEGEIKRDISEHLSSGGQLQIISQGGVIAEQGSTINISGGQVEYLDGYLNITQLTLPGGGLVNISQAAADIPYTGVFGSVLVKSPRWGAAGERSWNIFSGGGISQFNPGYIEGKDAGSILIQANAEALAGDIVAGTLSSEYQRSLQDRALGGSLSIVLGNDNKTAQNAVITGVRQQQDVTESQMLAFLNDTGSVPGWDLEILDGQLNDGLSACSLTTTGDVHIRHDAKVNMTTASTIDAAGSKASSSFAIDARSINVDGQLRMASGEVKLQTHKLLDQGGDLIVNNVIDVSGGWSNDRVAGADLRARVNLDGGSVSLLADGDLILTGTSVLQANAGAWLQSNSKIKQGRGGKIKLATVEELSPGERSQLQMNGITEAYGLSTGGQLDITANTINIASHFTQPVETGELELLPKFFTQNGFSSYSLTSNLSHLLVASDSELKPETQSLVLNGDYSLYESGTNIKALTEITSLPDYARAATNLSLQTNQSAGAHRRDGLVIAADSTITLDAGAKLSLSSDSSLFMDGALGVAGGDVELKLTADPDNLDYQADKAIWINGSIDVTGTLVADQPNPQGLILGQVYDSGEVNIHAKDGYIILADGSRIDVSGNTRQMDVPDQVSGKTVISYQRQDVASDAGKINLTAAEGIQARGGVLGQAAAIKGASGGELVVELNVSERSGTRDDGNIVSTEAREIHLVNSNAELVGAVASGSVIPDTFKGQAWLSAASVKAGGFDRLTLVSMNNDDHPVSASGVIQFGQDVNLTLGESLQLLAPVIRGSGGSVNLTAPYLHMGAGQDQFASASHDSVSLGTTMLNLHAGINDQDGLLELSGNVVADNFGELNLSSNGDIRLRGIWHSTTDKLAGSLHAAGNINLQADQLYATTLSEYNLVSGYDLNNILVNAAATLTIDDNGDKQTQPVLSAASQLTLKAPGIAQNGTVKAPLGQINFVASDSLVLSNDSLTSVSAENQLIPFGTTAGQQQWKYVLRPFVEDSSSETSISIDAPVEKVINFGVDGQPIADVDIDDSAVIDISGGGDLYAWEFVPGIGGSQDNLLAENANGAFAVISGMTGFAPYDHAYSLDDNGATGIGSQTYITGNNLLAEGVYTILPARYALLPGAFLVTPVSGYDNIQQGQVIQNINGTSVIAARQQLVGTDHSDQFWQAYTIENGQAVRARSEYFESTASRFFRNTAERNDTQLPAMPEDAGSLNIVVSNNLNLSGVLHSDVGTVSQVLLDGSVETVLGRGSQLNIAADHLRIVTELDNADGIQIRAAELNAFDANSIMLGGTRRRTAGGSELLVLASLVEVEDNVTVPDLILAANDRVVIHQDVKINATGDAGVQDRVLTVSGDGALFKASAGEQVSIRRGNETGAVGTLEIQSDAVISADRSLALDSSKQIILAGLSDAAKLAALNDDSLPKAQLQVNHGSLNLGASRISLGDTGTANPQGLVLSADDLQQLNASEFVLTSRSSVDLYGSLDLAFDNLSLETGSVDGYQQADEIATLSVSNTLRMSNPSGQAQSGAAPGTGRLILNATNIELGDAPLDEDTGIGGLALRGFSGVELQASENMVATGSGVMDFNISGDLVFDVGRLTATSASEYRLQANNSNLKIKHSLLDVTDDINSLGAKLAIQANSIDHHGLIQLQSGSVSLHALSGDLNIAKEDPADANMKGPVIDTAGIVRDFAGEAVYTSGGTIRLLADQGNLQVDDSAILDVSGGAGLGDAGGLIVNTPNGEANINAQLLATHGDEAKAGSFELDANSIANSSQLNTVLNDSGFTGRRHLRLRSGDINLGVADSIHADDILLQADAGNVVIAGQMNASNDEGGRVNITAANNVQLLATASIEAKTLAANKDGGDVFLGTAGGFIDLAAGSVIDVSGGAVAAGGKIYLRAPRNTGHNNVNISTVAGSNLKGFSRVDIEGYRRYTMADGLLTAADLVTPFSESHSFMQNDVLASLGLASLANVHLRAGIELYRDGDITVGGDVDFINQRYDNNGNTETGIFNLIATGDLAINNTIQDGFISEIDYISTYGFGVPRAYDRLQSGESWSYRLVAGHDATAANMLSTIAGSGDLNIATNKKVRTGTGAIELAAGGDFVLAQDSSLYTAGQSSGRGGFDMPLSIYGMDTNVMEYVVAPGLEFPENGGDISIKVAGDIKNSSPSSFLVTDWLHRVAGNFPVNLMDDPATPDIDESKNLLPTMMGVDFSKFNHGIAALGGGDINIEATGDIENLMVSIPEVIKFNGSADVVVTEETTANLIIHNYDYVTDVVRMGKGDLHLQTEGNIIQSQFYVANGQLDVTTTGSIGNAQQPNSGLMLLTADTATNIHAAGDIYLQGVANPTLLPISQLQQDNYYLVDSNTFTANPLRSYFSTYSEDNQVVLASLGGDVVLRNDIGGPLYNNVMNDSSVDAMASYYPASLRIEANNGDITIDNNMVMLPGANGELSLLAEGSVIAKLEDNGTSLSLLMSDAAVDSIAGVENPVVDFLTTSSRTEFARQFQISEEVHAETPVHLNDANAVRLVANTGDIGPSVTTGGFSLQLPKKAELVAGRDIRGVSLNNQNIADNDITLIQAGRDIRYLNSEIFTSLNIFNNDITVAGPGEVQVLAGRHIDLGDQGGIKTIGNNINTALGNRGDGAGLTMLAGLGEQGMNLSGFVEQYLTLDSEYSQMLINEMQQQGAGVLSFAAAKQQFEQLPEIEQRSFVLSMFFNEIKQSTIRGANEQAGKIEDGQLLGYSRGLDAIAALFPDSIASKTPVVNGESSADGENILVTGGYKYEIPVINQTYRGDISLVSSVIKTDNGGDVNVLAPGGLLNVGLTVATGDSTLDKGILAKANGNIHVYTHNDVAVNESRIQALDGGEIVGWSTMGDIDAGRGAQSVLNIPPPRSVVDPQTGQVSVIFDASVQGSGIRTASFRKGVKGGDVVLAAPKGAIDAGDAGINSEGSGTFGTETILNSENIDIAGSSTVPAADSGLGVSLSLDVNSSGVDAAQASSMVAQDASDQFGEGAVAILRVEVLGLGDDAESNE